jgi:arabinan endo-1,5-alpha-L-arabinosidase
MAFSRYGVCFLTMTLASVAACGSGSDASPGATDAGSSGTQPAGSAGETPAEGGSGAGDVGSPAGGQAGSPSAGSTAAAGDGGSTVGSAGPLGGDGGQASGPPTTLELSGDITNIHDPQVIEEDGVYYLFSTGVGISVHTSDDLHAWKSSGQVFAKKPSWITTTDPSNPNHLWAPEVVRFGGQYHLFYAASKFGSQSSCIGHATRSTLSGDSGWTDSGKAVLCTTAGNDYNAIDPHPFVDEEGGVWLALGSFWTGLKMVRLKDDGSRNGTDLYSLATRPNTAVEAPYLVYRGGFYYLFESVDSCCKGADSTYKIMVGRSPNVTGPFTDKDGKALTAGGATLVLAGGDRWRGPGHNAILHTQGRDYNVYHSYDADNAGVPTLRISQLDWAQDGWPQSAGP